MTTTPPGDPAPTADAAPAADPAATARANAGARAKVLGWARQSIDLIPTRWLLLGGAAILLSTTAVFGGLETAPASPLPEVEVGETFTGSDLEMTVVGVEVREERGNAMVFPDEERGERVLVVTVDVVNTFNVPRLSVAGGNDSPVIDGIRFEGLDEKASVSRADDGEGSPMLQPDVPARLLLAWVVDEGAYHDGDEVRLTLPDSTHRVGKSVVRGDFWDDVRVGATVTVEVETR